MADERGYRGVQALRGLAAGMVVVHHATQLWSMVASHYKAPFWDNGAAGVDIFFVISGFVMAVSLAGRGPRHPSALRFFERRVTRIVPLYWLVTLAFLLRLAVHLHHAGGSMTAADPDISVKHIFESLTFIPYRNSVGYYMPIVNVGWSLSYEMFFYLLIAGALALRVNWYKTLVPLMIGLAAVGAFRPRSWPAVTVLLSPMLLEFVAGVLLGQLALSGFRMHPGLAAVLGAIAMPLLFFSSATQFSRWRVAWWGILALLIVHAAVALEKPYAGILPKWMLLIGDASYSLYLSHALVFSASARYLIDTHVLRAGVTNRGNEMLVCAILLALAVTAAIPLYVYVEMPMLAFLRKKTGTRMAIGGRPVSEATTH